MNKTFTILIFLAFGVNVQSQVTMQKQNGGFLFTENGENVMFYQKEPLNLEGKYERCNYIHPLWGIDGNILTEDFPSDHFHHRGIFWAWHQVWVGDKQIGDPWELKDFEQQVINIEFVAKKDGIAVFNTEVYWKSDLWKIRGEKTPYLREKTTITIQPKRGNYRKIDFEIRLIALADDLKIGGSADEKGYSGFSVRMKLPENVDFSGPEGKVIPENTAVKSPGFVNISGSVGKNNNSGGIVIVDNPENPGYPQQWILRNRNSMQNAAYPGNKLISISTVEPLVLKYSLIIYSGKLNNTKIKKIID